MCTDTLAPIAVSATFSRYRTQVLRLRRNIELLSVSFSVRSIVSRRLLVPVSSQ